MTEVGCLGLYEKFDFNSRLLAIHIYFLMIYKSFKKWFSDFEKLGWKCLNQIISLALKPQI